MSLPTCIPSYDMLLGACAAHNLNCAGTIDELKRRLGDHLVAQMFTPNGKKRANPTSDTAGADPKRPPTAWVTFLREEKDRVKEAGFTGRVDIIKQCARRSRYVYADSTTCSTTSTGYRTMAVPSTK